MHILQTELDEVSALRRCIRSKDSASLGVNELSQLQEKIQRGIDIWQK
jgi:hypothetical protein